MKNNNLNKVENTLRSIAKRYKSIKYSLGLAILFLMVGVSAFSEEVVSKEKIQNSIGSLQSKIDTAKKENAKQLKGLRLELVQLMEQGEQVIKMPWASWQYGVGYTYNSWGSEYKGRGDKKALVGAYDRLSGSAKYAQNSNNGNYSLTSLNLIDTAEPNTEISVSAGIRPKSVNKQAPTMNLPTINSPRVLSLNVSLASPEAIPTPSINSPNINPVIPNPVVDTNVDLTATNGKIVRLYNDEDLKDSVFWSGHNGTNYVATSGVIKNGGLTTLNQATTYYGPNKFMDYNTSKNATSPTTYTMGSNRAASLIYMLRANHIAVAPPLKVENVKMYLAGNVGGAGLTGLEDEWTSAASGGITHEEQVGFHIGGFAEVKNVEAHLYGKTAFSELESFNGTVVDYQNTKIKIERDNNKIFYFWPGVYGTFHSTLGEGASKYRKLEITGNINADIPTNKNTVYYLIGIASPTRIESTGSYRLSGSNNIVYSGVGYSPNYDKFKGTGLLATTGSVAGVGGFKGSINLTTPVESYGDENIILFFSKKVIPDPNLNVWGVNAYGGKAQWDKSTVGIYQGEINAKAKTGYHLGLVSSGNNYITQDNSQQTGKGESSGNAKYVEKNVGVLALSGQRAGIIPSTDLGALPGLTQNAKYDNDTIHSLQINNLDMTYGKFAKDNIMLVSRYGTILDVKKSSNEHDLIPVDTTVLKDYDVTYLGNGKISNDDSKNYAATGTIIAYSEGTWKNTDHNMSSSTALANEGKGSEINIGTDVILTSRYKKIENSESYPIGYMATNSGIITIEGNTEAKGYKSIVAYARNYGDIKLGYNSKTSSYIANKGTIKAIDEWVANDNATKSLKYQNIAAYAKQDETNASNVTKDTSIVINGNVTVNGIAALADGIRTKVELKGTSNLVNTSRDGGLVAKNKGQIVFVGGTINNKNNKTDVNPTTGAILKDANGNELNDHKNTVPFYADNGSKVTFGSSTTTTKTTINMYDGVLVYGKPADYDAGYTSATARYFGMGKVTVELKGNGVNLGVFEEINPTWNGNDTTYLNVLKTVPKFAAINNPNGYRYKSTLTRGTLTINTNVNLTSASDKFNDILMEREKVIINAGKTITGGGKGLSMGSNKNATSNAETGYTNRGIVNISGGTTSKGVAGINVSYGNILNDTKGTVSVNIGAGLYATNDSRVENRGTINITGSGTGIAVKGIADKQEKNKAGKLVTVPAFNYGNTGKIEIVNSGKINVAGNNAIAIYAHNNNNTAQNSVKITNNSSLSLGNNGVGILLKGNGGLINLGGNSTIKVGTNGIGVYGEKSVVTLNTNQTIETKENGVGIYTTGTSKIVGGKTLTYKYTGANNKTGIATLFAGTNSQNNINIQLSNSTNTTGGMVGAFVSGGGTFNNTGNITGSTSAKEAGIIAENTNIVNSGKITLSGNPTSLNNTNVAIYSKTANSITNSGDISVGKNSVGIYGHSIVNTANLTVGDKSIAVYSKSGNVNLSGNINIGKNEAVGLFTSGNNQTITSNANLSIGDSSYGYVIKGNGTNLTINSSSTTVGNNTVFAYSSDKTANIVNNTNLTSTGKNNYGLYTSSYTENNADINFGSSTGNVGIYVTDGGRAINMTGKTITVGGSDTTDPSNSYYGIGMAAGYQDTNRGTIENKGTIKVTKDNSIGMYASGSGSMAINRGTIELSGNKTVGMYLDNNAVGENYGTIKTVPSPDNKGIIGVVALNGSIIKNYGEITISAPNGVGVFYKGNNVLQEQAGSKISAPTRIQTTTQAQTGKGVKGIDIKAPAGVTTAQIIRNGVNVNPLNIDTTISSPEATQVRVGNTTLNISNFNIPNNIGGASSEIGMYVDTSGVRYTNPIRGLSNLRNLEKINLIFGVEASRYTNAKDIVIGENILKPYNDAILEVTRTGSGETKWLIKSNSLTWIATGTQNSNDTFAKVYLSKIPYTSFAKDNDTYNFMNGLEQRYGVEGIGSKERSVFEKLNELGKGEGNIFAQAVDEMKGNQYANIEQRVYSTSQILDKEFSNLGKEWKTLTKNSNKIKTFGSRGEYKTDTAGIVDYTNNAYGLVYIKENEDINLGKSLGWYAGFIHNKFKFKDIGRSKEDMLQGKVGLYKSIPFDDNNSLNWTISGDISMGYNKMNRRFLVVDEIFNAKSKYYTYGVGIKNEIGKEFRLSEDFSLRPYGALKLEYGRISKIKEKSGEIRLDVKEKNYVSIKPEAGTELLYRHYFGVKTLKVGLGVAYENELGKVANNDTKAKVANTTADWYNLRAEKEDRRGNVKTDLTVGFDNQMYGVTANIGYDTKGENIRGGLGLRVIF